MYVKENHLGNVLSTVTDTRIAHSTGGTSIDYFEAKLKSSRDYAAFGGLMPGRGTAIIAGGYKFGFNGKEKDDDIKNIVGSSYDFGARIYDPRLGRWLNPDPLAKGYPELSPYNFSNNSPLQFIDKDGNYIDVSVTKVTKQNNKVTVNADIKIKMKIVNLSGQAIAPEKMQKFIEDAKSQTKMIFSGEGSYTYNDGTLENGKLKSVTTDYNLNVSIDLQEVNNLDGVSNNDNW